MYLNKQGMLTDTYIHQVYPLSLVAGLLAIVFS